MIPAETPCMFQTQIFFLVITKSVVDYAFFFNVFDMFLFFSRCPGCLAGANLDV